MDTITQKLLASKEPSIRYKTLVNILGEPRDSKKVASASLEVKNSPLIKTLLSEKPKNGHIPRGAYDKWVGDHWVLSLLADLGYPKGDKELVPMMEHELEWLLGENHVKNAIRVINGLTRRCCSQEANAVYSLITLGIADERVETLVKKMLSWQWPDGGWNCDKEPGAKNSSFHESLIPMRALFAYSKATGDKKALEAAKKTSEIFLKRKLFKKVSDGSVINPKFTKICYPSYWHYNILACLTYLAEAGQTGDARCTEALDLLESKRLPDGSFPAETKYYSYITCTQDKNKSGSSLINFGGTSSKAGNEFVTADAVFVLKTFGKN